MNILGVGSVSVYFALGVLACASPVSEWRAAGDNGSDAAGDNGSDAAGSNGLDAAGSNGLDAAGGNRSGESGSNRSDEAGGNGSDAAGGSGLDLSDSGDAGAAGEADGSGGGVATTPVTNSQQAAGALHAAMLVETDVYFLSSYLSNGAEESVLAVLAQAAKAGQSLPADLDATLPLPVVVPCPEGGEYALGWRKFASTGGEALELAANYRACRGLLGPESETWIVEDNGTISLGFVTTTAYEGRVSSARFGGDTADYTRSFTHRVDQIMAFQTVANYQIDGDFMQNAEFVGDFSYQISGSRKEFNYSPWAGDPPGTIRMQMFGAEAQQLVVTGSRRAQPSSSTIELDYVSGTLVRLLDDPNQDSSPLPFEFYDFALKLENRESEGNKSVSMSGIVSVAVPQAGDQTCTSGTFRYQTIEPFLEGTTNYGPGVFPQFSQGELRINENVLVKFLRKQELEITIDSNSPMSYQNDSSASFAIESAINCFVEF